MKWSTHMNCPIDGTELRITERQGIEIDYCPQCRGIWLDRGELDKIIERSSVEVTPQRPPTAERRDWDDDDDNHKYYGKEKRKRRSFLDDIFDF